MKPSGGSGGRSALPGVHRLVALRLVQPALYVVRHRHLPDSIDQRVDVQPRGCRKLHYPPAVLRLAQHEPCHASAGKRQGLAYLSPAARPSQAFPYIPAPRG
ncbi:MAG: hypothetical protein BWY92_00977 [Firmicutes bacterium ADurb.BinA052]|nr:MAG: hypothetical protein BWY92_00977 [Firmicutes bacterium ADurb.BinA052]